MTTKTVPLRLSTEEVEEVRLFSELNHRSQAFIMREAVQQYLERERAKLHPLSLPDAVELESLLNMDCRQLVASSSMLSTNQTWGNIAGVYLLAHPETRELYVGSSTDIAARMAHHKHAIKQHNHSSAVVSQWNVNEVVVVLLETTNSERTAELKAQLLSREQHFINKLRTQKLWVLANTATASTTPTLTSLPVGAATGEFNTTQEVGTKKTSRPKNNTSKATVRVVEPLPAVNVADDDEPDYDSYDSFQRYYIEEMVVPVLEEASSSQDLRNVLDGAKLYGDRQYEWTVEFVRNYNSPWLRKLVESGRFQWLTDLLAS